MIEFFQDLRTIGLTAFFNPAFLVLLIILFFLGKLVGWMIRSVNIWKFLALGYFGIFLFRPLQDAGVVLGGIFILGVASMYTDLFRSIFNWSGNLGDMFSAFRNRGVYEDIRRLEEEMEELKRQLRAAQMGADSSSRSGSSQQQKWRNQSQARKSKPKDGDGLDGRGSDGTTSQDRRFQRSKSSFILPHVRDKHLQTLELVLGQTYSEKDIKAAWRMVAFKTHPDSGGSASAFRAAYDAYQALMTV